MSIQVNVNPTVLSEKKEYRGLANIDGTDYKFDLVLRTQEGKKNIVVVLDGDYYNALMLGDEKGFDALEAIEKQIEENIVYNDVW